MMRRPIAMQFALWITAGAAFAQLPCAELRSLKLENATVKVAESVSGHCRVALVLTPSADSHIEMEAWLPESGWNGKFQAVGNGGWAGSIGFASMEAALREGYATASTDTGH